MPIKVHDVQFHEKILFKKNSVKLPNIFKIFSKFIPPIIHDHQGPRQLNQQCFRELFHEKILLKKQSQIF